MSAGNVKTSTRKNLLTIISPPVIAPEFHTVKTEITCGNYFIIITVCIIFILNNIFNILCIVCLCIIAVLYLCILILNKIIRVHIVNFIMINNLTPTVVKLAYSLYGGVGCNNIYNCSIKTRSFSDSEIVCCVNSSIIISRSGTY